MVRKSIQLTANLRSGPILVDCEQSLFSQSSLSSASLRADPLNLVYSYIHTICDHDAIRGPAAPQAKLGRTGENELAQFPLASHADVLRSSSRVGTRDKPLRTFPRSRDHPGGLLAVYNFSGSHTFSLTDSAKSWA